MPALAIVEDLQAVEICQPRQASGVKAIVDTFGLEGREEASRIL